MSTPPDSEGGWQSSWQRPQEGEWKQSADGSWYKDTGSAPAPASPEWERPQAPAGQAPAWNQAPEAPRPAAPPAWNQAPAPPPAAPAWNQPAEPGYAPARPASGKAVAALILGIGGLSFCPVILSVFALVLGYQARAEIDREGGRVAGRGQATAGIVLGWIGIAIFVLFLGLVILGIAVGSGDVSTEFTPS